MVGADCESCLPVVGDLNDGVVGDVDLGVPVLDLRGVTPGVEGMQEFVQQFVESCACGVQGGPQAARAHIALSEGLVEDAFAGNLAGDSALRWQYVGFQSGVFRNFPANPTKTNHIGAANDYDPRARPWYLSSVSGAKDVMIVVDCSER